MSFKSSISEVKYRPEIDGLRAIAIIPILMFHFGYSIFSGGFTGVDIFFVISGYLITSIISNKLTQNNFTFHDFYLRRAKRILPLLFLVLFTCVPFAWLLMLPSELSDFGQSLLHAASFTANIHFRHSANYFAANSDQIPLLHIWSLAVEEQFYLVFPFILIILNKRHSDPTKTFLIILIASLAICIWASHHAPSKNFYWLPPRAWEFMFGAIAFTLEKKLNLTKPLNQVVSFLGLMLIFYGIFEINDQMPFPGIYALIPVMGTFLLITFAKPESIITNILSISPIRFIGKISYSLYLWHFPVLVFSNFLHLRYATTINPIFLILTTLILSILSYLYIENPFRSQKYSNNKTVIALTGAFLILMLLGYSLKHFTSFYKKYNVQQIEFLEKISQKSQVPGFDECNIRSIEKPCSINSNSNNSQAVLVGDSHAFTIFHSLGQELQKKNIGLTLQLKGNCPPLITDDKHYLSNKCLAREKEVFQKILNDQDIETIIIFARWNWYMEGTPFNNGKGGVGEKYNDFLKNDYSTLDERHALFQVLYKSTFNQLEKSGKKVIIVNTVPEPGWNVPKQILSSLYSNKDYNDTFFDYKEFRKRNYNVDQLLEQYRFNKANIKIYDPSNSFCNSIQSICNLTLNKIPLYMDDNHVSDLGSSLIAEGIANLM
jgi:peptidoglycan/LPS O-acetylase OafA/YrhL